MSDTMPLTEQQIQAQLAELSAWQWDKAQARIRRDFRFNNFHQTMDFVNAVAAIAHAEDHHPDMEIGYNHCLINYTTHSLGGLSDKDFICARQIDALPNKT